MNTPIFQLEHVVKIKEEDALENFVGPLDLILYLLSKNKIAIQDIKIADLLDQYLAYIEQCQTMDLEVASEFVAMAAHLVYIKTRMLLSIEDEEAKSEMDQLIRSLEERQRNEADTGHGLRALWRRAGQSLMGGGSGAAGWNF